MHIIARLRGLRAGMGVREPRLSEKKLFDNSKKRA
jgi:hypothetical protein